MKDFTLRNQLILAVALVVTELIAGMQAYLGQMILPIMAADLAAQPYYGLIVGTGAISQFIGLPVGASLIRRYKISQMLIILTLGIVVGATLSALAPNIWIYLPGSALRSFAGGCMATVTIGAVALGLQGRARQLTLAFSSAGWVVASIVGPTYAAWITHLLSWRWAMLMYLPVLLVARWIIATHLKVERSTSRPPLHIGNALVLGLGVGITIVPLQGAWKITTVVCGILILIYGAVRILPTGTFTSTSPRRVSVAVMFFLTGGYFAANEVITLTYHDVYQGDAKALGVVILAGGLSWALIGLICGAKPAASIQGYVRRGTSGMFLMTASFGAIAAGMLIGLPTPAIVFFTVLWAIASVGMGMLYVDTLNVMFEEPSEPDGLDPEAMAGAAVMAESVSSAVFVTLATTFIGTSFAGQPGAAAIAASYLIVWGCLALVSTVVLVYLLRLGRTTT